MHLTDLTIRGLPYPTSGQKEYPDTAVRGLFVKVGQRTKTFMLTVRRQDKRERVKLGTYPDDLTLAKAREKARDILAERRMRPQKEAEAKLSVPFKEALAKWQDTYLETIQAGSRYQAKRIMAYHFAKPLGRKALHEIASSDLARIFDPLTGTPAEARNAFIYLRSFLNWCVKRDYIENSPLGKLDPPKRGTGRERVLTDPEIVAIWRAAPTSAYGDVLKLCILSGQRIGQWRHWKQEYLAGDRVGWPSAVMKIARRHELPLTPMMTAILDGRTEFSFWDGGKDKRALEKRLGLPNWTHQDIRRTVATKLAELGVAPHIIERILAHQNGQISGVAAVYNRHSYFPETKAALELWQDRLSKLLDAWKQAA